MMIMSWLRRSLAGGRRRKDGIQDWPCRSFSRSGIRFEAVNTSVMGHLLGVETYSASGGNSSCPWAGIVLESDQMNGYYYIFLNP